MFSLYNLKLWVIFIYVAKNSIGTEKGIKHACAWKVRELRINTRQQMTKVLKVSFLRRGNYFGNVMCFRIYGKRKNYRNTVNTNENE